jgi:hypothetical protein
MRTQETINQVKKACSLELSVTFNKGVSFIKTTGKFSQVWSAKKSEGYEYLKNVSEASVKIEHTQKVVDSTIKKLEKMGFSIEEVDNHIWDFGRVDRWVIIRK